MKLPRWAVFLSGAALALLSVAPALAADYNAELTLRLFTATCMRRLGMPEAIRIWAKEARLPPITDPNALNTFVGTTPGAKGAAWVLPSPSGRKLTLSIRAGTEACALWAEAGDPPAAEDLFRKLVAEVAQPDKTVSTEEDLSFATATGKARLLTMSVTDKKGDGFLFSFKAGDRTGTFFSGAPVQLSMQMERLEGAGK